ncbi:MAG: hypothetical protein ACI9GW_001473 [Halieaceae bacterium]|jgi:hypothetical protein
MNKPRLIHRLTLRSGLLQGSAILALISTTLFGMPAGGVEMFEPVAAGGGPPVIRRLTQEQYRATVADLFGADMPVVGRFERALRSDGLIAMGTSEAGLSRFAIEQYDASARGVAAAVVSAEHREELVPCEPRSEKQFDRDCAEKFVSLYGKQLFRRPLFTQEKDRFVAAASAAQSRLGNFYSGLEFALIGMMVSPEFLLRIERVEEDPGNPGQYRLDGWSRASRLSYFLSGSTPDAELLRAAAEGELYTREGLEQQAARMLGSPRFESALRAFFADMLQFDLFDDLAKDPIIYPSYNSTVAVDAREQTLRTITDHLLVGEGDYRGLFTTRSAPLTRALGTVYRMPVAVRNGWAMGKFSESSGRAGIQSQIGFLALHSHPGRSSPTLRGKAVREIFLCQHVPDPPVDVDFIGINDTSNVARPTARHRLEAHRTQIACKGCHTLMDPVGLTLENFDGAGSFRRKENGALIDVSGSLDGVEFEAAGGLGQALHDHPLVPNCLVGKMYRSAVGRDTVASEWAYLKYLNQVFAAQGYRVPELMRTIATSDAFYAVTPPQSEKIAEARNTEGDQS